MSNKYLNSMIFINKKKLKVIKEENNEIYLSKVIKFDDFKKIIVSWNAVRIDVDTLSINEGYSGKAIELKIISYYDNKGFAADIREVAITYYKENNNDLKNKKYELINKLIETQCI